MFGGTASCICIGLYWRHHMQEHKSKQQCVLHVAFSFSFSLPDVWTSAIVCRLWLCCMWRLVCRCGAMLYQQRGWRQHGPTRWCSSPDRRLLLDGKTKTLSQLQGDNKRNVFSVRLAWTTPCAKIASLSLAVVCVSCSKAGCQLLSMLLLQYSGLDYGLWQSDSFCVNSSSEYCLMILSASRFMDEDMRFTQLESVEPLQIDGDD